MPAAAPSFTVSINVIAVPITTESEKSADSVSCTGSWYKMMKRFLHLPDMEKGLADQFSKNRKLLTCCFTATFAVGLLAHAYGFLTCNLNHDYLNAFIATAAEDHVKMEVGRFFVPLYRALVRGNIALPWLIGVLGMFWTGWAAFLTMKIFDVRSGPQAVLISAVMICNVTWLSQIAVYLFEFDCNAFSLLMAVTAVWLWRKRSFPAGILLGGVCILLSIGIYQSYINVTVSLIIWASIMDLLNGGEEMAVVKKGFAGIAMLLLGGLLYLLLNKLAYGVMGIEQMARTSVTAASGQDGLLIGYAKLILPAMKKLFGTIVHPVYESFLLRYSVVAVTVFLIGSILAFLIRKKYHGLRILLLFVLAGVLPFGMNATFFLAGGEGVHDVMMYAAWYFYVFVLLLAFRLCDPDMLPGKCSRFVRDVACVVVVFLLWQTAILSNTAYVKKERESDAALSTMTRVVAMMENFDGYEFNRTPVAFIGSAAMMGNHPEYARFNNVVGVGMTTPIPQDKYLDYYNVYKTYFEYVLQYPVVLCDNDVHSQLKYSKEVLEMPDFPDKGCIRFIGDVLVVKVN